MEGGETKFTALPKSSHVAKAPEYKPNMFNKNTYNRLKKAREAQKAMKC